MYFEAFSRNVNQVIDVSTAIAKKYGCRYIFAFASCPHIQTGILGGQIQLVQSSLNANLTILSSRE